MLSLRRRGSGALSRVVDSGGRSAEIAGLLDGLAGPERVRETLSIAGQTMARLYEAVADAEPLTLDDVVPPTAPASATIIYAGRNSLPAFSRFQKRFARLAEGRIIGHNHQPWSLVIGPGYFVVRPASLEADVPGEPYFDYTVAPGYEPTGWPAYRPNDWGPSLLVFAGMQDYLRRVARGVMVGKAYKRSKPAGYYFVLGRAD